MDRLESNPNGGIPVEWNDFRWESDAVRMAFNNLLKGLGKGANANYIVWGCTAGGGGHLAGAVCINGELCSVDALTTGLPAVGGGQVLEFHVVETDDPTGAELMQNAVAINQYKIRKGVLVSAVATGAPVFGSSNIQNLLNPLLTTTTGSLASGNLSFTGAGGGSLVGFTYVNRIGNEYTVRINATLNVTTATKQVKIDLAALLQPGETIATAEFGPIMMWHQNPPTKPIIPATYRFGVPLGGTASTDLSISTDLQTSLATDIATGTYILSFKFSFFVN